MERGTQKDIPKNQTATRTGAHASNGFSNEDIQDSSDTGYVSNENQPLLHSPSTDDFEASDVHGPSPWNNDAIEDPEYLEVIQQAERAIETGVLPVRIAAGSSGSYFVRNPEGKTIGVFKPKDEEPYGRFNPKWTKWLQKVFCPFCFGRGCLVPNQGYLSEAGASIIDTKLRLNIVPKTHVVRLAADSFNYPAYRRHLISAKRGINENVGRRMHGRRMFRPKGLPPKSGSFQIFKENYVDADVFLQQLEQKKFPEEAIAKFQKQFERLVVLDYIIRNTDRNNGNWLVKYQVKDNDEDDNGGRANNADELDDVDETDYVSVSNRIQIPSQTHDVFIAAIDNGLAFPFKHPDEWRTYPFHWAWLPQSKIPFSEEIKSLVVPLLTDPNFVQHQLCDPVEDLFLRDRKSNSRVVERQLSVMRGQIVNLVQAMKDGKSPFQLVQMPGVIVERSHDGPNTGPRQFRQRFSKSSPILSFV